LRKICIIDGSPLPLIQREIFRLLFEGQEGPFIYGIGYDNNDTIVLRKILSDSDETEEIDIRDFKPTKLDESEINYILDQIALEADLCYGRNKFSVPYFKERYPIDKLIYNIINENVPK
jgi:hypothetical protein